MDPTARIARKPKKKGPMADWAKLCTEVRTPLRTTKVPNTLRRKVTMINPMFQTFSMPFRSWIMIE